MIRLKFGIVKYVFIFLYLLLIVSIILLSRFFDDMYIAFFIIALIFAISMVLIFVPIKYKKIGYHKFKKAKIIPIIIFSLMFAILIFSLNLTLSEFFDGKYEEISLKLFSGQYVYIVTIAIWAVFSLIGIIVNLKKDTDNIYKKYLTALLGGSVLELIITVPMHLYIVKRGGCFAGLTSIFGVIGGLLVLTFVMGPSIFLFIIFFHKKFSKNKKMPEKTDGI